MSSIKLTIPTLAPNPELDALLSTPYPSKAHARRVASLLPTKGTIYLEAAPLLSLEDTDTEAPFRQRRPFYYLSGCPLPDCFLTYEILSDKLTLYIPPMDPESVMWSGLPMGKDEAKNKFDVDEVRFTTEFLADRDLPGAAEEGTKVYVYGTKQVSRAFSPATAVDNTSLKKAMDEARVVKDDYEIGLMTRANGISALAHNTLLSAASKLTNEREAQAIFEAVCMANGATTQAYHGIFAGGRNAATLHYVKNNMSLVQVPVKPGETEKPQLMLVDAGAEFNCYASDITRVIPLGGAFSAEAAAIYDLVLRMQKDCIAASKPGIQWTDVHILAHRILITGLTELGIFRKGSDPEQILADRTSCAFLPHGLGHWIGLDTHDVGGNPDYADKDPMLKWVRVRRELVAGAVVTVEPGVYFCPDIVEEYLKEEKHRRWVDEEVLGRYWAVGGVRIEDDVVVEQGGGRSLSEGAVKERAVVEQLVVKGEF